MTIDTLTEEAERAAERIRIEMAVRKLMIMMVGLIGMWASILIILTGAPDFIENWFSPWTRYYLGGIALLGGVLVVAGAAIGDMRRVGYWLQIAGLSIMTLWYLGMCISYIALLSVQGMPIVGPGEALPPGATGRGYVPAIYSGLSLMAGVPLVAVMRLGRPACRVGS